MATFDFRFSRILRFVCLIVTGSVLLGNTNGALDLTAYVNDPQASISTSSSSNRLRWVGFFLDNPTVSLKLGRAADTGMGDPNAATIGGTATCRPRSWKTLSETCNDESIGNGLSSNIRLNTHNVPGVRVYMPRNDRETVGVFYFEISNGEETTRVTFIQLQSSAPIVPKTLTKTVSVYDTNVEIKMVTSETPVRWRKDGLVINEWWESTVTLGQVGPSDAGIYECYATEGDRTRGLQGITRLIVRGCPVGKWGPPYCNDDCPLCLNGGQCDHNTGECVCPVAFNGDYCQNPCGYNKFGKGCTGVCSSRGSPSWACRGNAFCMPDPVGCMCNAGFKGIKCNKDCVSGTFGSGCTQTCHCASGSSVCNWATGECSSGGCEAGWSGVNCQECEAGRFGSHCSQICHCADGPSVCNRATGECSSGGCEAGWSGDNCQQPGPSGPPSNVRYDSLNSTGVLFTWDQPLCGERGEVITGYKYKLYEGTQADGKPLRGKKIVSNSKRFGNLKPLTDYTFTVSAYTSAGRGPYSQGVSFRTPKKFNIPSAPRHVSLPSATRNSITVQWYAPPGDLELTSYTVQYWRTDQAYPSFKEIDIVENLNDSKQRYTIENLDTGFNYSIWVRATNLKGDGPWSNILTLATEELVMVEKLEG